MKGFNFLLLDYQPPWFAQMTNFLDHFLKFPQSSIALSYRQLHEPIWDDKVRSGEDDDGPRSLL